MFINKNGTNIFAVTCVDVQNGLWTVIHVFLVIRITIMSIFWLEHYFESILNMFFDFLGLSSQPVKIDDEDRVFQ